MREQVQRPPAGIDQNRAPLHVAGADHRGQVDLSRMTNDFHFDTQIIVKLHHQGLRLQEVPIPTYYGSEKCYVPLMKYGIDVLKTMSEYLLHRLGIKKSAYLEIDGPIARKAVPSVQM